MSDIGITQSISWNIHALVGLTQDVSWDVEAPTVAVPDPPTACAPPCYDDGRCGPFQRILIDFLVEGESHIEWVLRNEFAAPTPYTYQLQVGDTGNPLADDWQNVGPPVTNTVRMTDPTRRPLGKQMITHYRVLLTDNDGNQYYSQPAIVLGSLSMRYWLVAREILRQLGLSNRQGPGSVRGFILKRKRNGTPCTHCLDPYTRESMDGECPLCSGTGYIAGYYRAMPCRFAELTPVAITEQRDDGPAGWTAPTQIQGRFTASPMLATGDIWVNAVSDLRYHLETVNVENQISGVPITLQCVMQQLPFDHRVYKINLEEGP